MDSISNSESTEIGLLDEESIKSLYQQHYSYLCACVYKLIKDSTTAEDIVQEVFMDIWRKKDKLVIKISIKAYLRRAAINKTLNHIRSKKVVFEDEEKMVELGSKDPSTQSMMEGDELGIKIKNAIDSLPEKCRIVFGLSRFEELSYKEIAVKLDISVKTVENQISKALKHLKKELAEHIMKK
jgi:RNA polymerase sigma-70 factor (ECF subfamily)